MILCVRLDILAAGEWPRHTPALNRGPGNDRSLALHNPNANPRNQYTISLQLQHQGGFGRTPRGALALTPSGCVMPSQQGVVRQEMGPPSDRYQHPHHNVGESCEAVAREARCQRYERHNGTGTMMMTVTPKRHLL